MTSRHAKMRYLSSVCCDSTKVCKDVFIFDLFFVFVNDVQAISGLTEVIFNLFRISLKIFHYFASTLSFMKLHLIDFRENTGNLTLIFSRNNRLHNINKATERSLQDRLLLDHLTLTNNNRC